MFIVRAANTANTPCSWLPVPCHCPVGPTEDEEGPQGRGG